jgi:tRNA modification GTPase
MPDRDSKVGPTVAVELTPRGRAAVAVVLVAGPGAVSAVEACFHPTSGKRLADAPVDRILLGRWGGANGEELIVCRRANGTVEVHSHGGFAAVQNVIERLCAHGCQAMRWQDWARQTVSDPVRAAAQIALADAPTARAAGVLLDQFHGALARAASEAIEAAKAGDWPAAVRTIDKVLAQRSLGMHLTSPWRVVLAGRPNVGKSSLMNALAGYQRAIVCHLPGTTRDVVTITTAIDGWPMQISDTAGLRETTDAVESAGVARATGALADADLVLAVEDASDPDSGFLELLTPGAPVLHVLNKIDLLASPPASPSGKAGEIFTSAVAGQGIEALVAAIGRAMVPSPPAAGAAAPFTRDHCEAFEAASVGAEARDAAMVGAALAPIVGA